MARFRAAAFFVGTGQSAQRTEVEKTSGAAAGVTNGAVKKGNLR